MRRNARHGTAAGWQHAGIINQLRTEHPVTQRQFRYAMRGYRAQVVAAIALGAAAGLVVGGVGFTHRRIGYLIVAGLWLVALVGNARRVLTDVVYDLDVVGGGRVVWRTPLRSGVVELADLVLLRPFPRRSRLALLELADGSSLAVLVRKGFMPFAAALSLAQPGMPVALSEGARMVERLPLPSAFEMRVPVLRPRR